MSAKLVINKTAGSKSSEGNKNCKRNRNSIGENSTSSQNSKIESFEGEKLSKEIDKTTKFIIYCPRIVEEHTSIFDLSDYFPRLFRHVSQYFFFTSLPSRGAFVVHFYFPVCLFLPLERRHNCCGMRSN